MDLIVLKIAYLEHSLKFYFIGDFIMKETNILKKGLSTLILFSMGFSLLAPNVVAAASFGQFPSSSEWGAFTNYVKGLDKPDALPQEIVIRENQYIIDTFKNDFTGKTFKWVDASGCKRELKFDDIWEWYDRFLNTGDDSPCFSINTRYNTISLDYDLGGTDITITTPSYPISKIFFELIQPVGYGIMVEADLSCWMNRRPMSKITDHNYCREEAEDIYISPNGISGSFFIGYDNFTTDGSTYEFFCSPLFQVDVGTFNRIFSIFNFFERFEVNGKIFYKVKNSDFIDALGDIIDKEDYVQYNMIEEEDKECF